MRMRPSKLGGPATSLASVATGAKPLSSGTRLRRAPLARTAVLIMVLVGFSRPAAAASIVFDFNIAFSNAVTPLGPAPWLRATFDDTLASPGSDVRLTLETLGLVGQEFISEVSFNLNPAINPTEVVATKIANPNGTLQGLSAGVDAFQSAGGGKYDLLFTFGHAAGSRFTANETVVVDLNLVSGMLALGDFNVLAVRGGGDGPFYAAAHIQGIGPNGSASTWLADSDGPTGSCPGCTPTPTAVVPEPASLLLLGSALALNAVRARQQRKSAKI
jgi:hypothetical protein